MPQDTDTISLSGAALALLMFENVKSTCEQEGFLLGIVDELETRISTDANSHNVTRKVVVTINGVFPMSCTGLFYDGVGRINKKILKDILGQQAKQVVGWYIYGQQNSFQLTFRQKILHRQLSAYFNLPSELFSTCILLSNNLKAVTSYKLTHTCSHNFFRFVHGEFRVFPMQIETLNESCDGYKPNQKASKNFMNLYNATTSNNKSSEWQVIHDIQDALDVNTRESMYSLAQQETHLEKLRDEVKNLRLQLAEFKKCETEEKKQNERVDSYLIVKENNVQIEIKSNLNNISQTFQLLDKPKPIPAEKDNISNHCEMEIFPVEDGVNKLAHPPKKSHNEET